MPVIDEFVQVWRKPENWEQGVEALLYAARWADLNAKEAGQPEKAVHFAAYRKAFQDFFEDEKTIDWTVDGNLVVRLAGTGATHDLSELSDGEKQVIVLAAELLLRWRPGSLILIDEPELHLHEQWQLKLFELLLKFQKERGGQVILATQSDVFFGRDEVGSVLLRRRTST
jgi:predicted ATPase